MRLNELERWGIPSRVISQWQKRQGETLLPVQTKAIRKGLIGRPGEPLTHQATRMLISAPTSSGKSFCAELAAVRALTVREKTVMLFPLKSLAEQKYELFSRTYGELGVKCLIVTGDHPENDRRFSSGDYQIAVAIYEKFDQLLTSSLDALKTIGLVVVDEIQTIGEPGRGAVLERLLTKIKASDYSPSILGLSAVIGDDSDSAGRLSGWLDATLVEENSRPVELMRGVAAEGSYRYRLFNNGQDGTEPFVTSDSDNDSFEGFIKQVKDSDRSTLVFLKSRMNTVDAAFKLAAKVNWPEAARAISKLATEEPSFLVHTLRQALSRGVAFHSSDLSPRQRLIVEQAFLDKDVKVIFSTTTLAMGVNLFADVVYLETVKYTSGKYDHRPSLVPVSRAEFDNMSGRAGRYSSDESRSHRGRAVVLADNEFDRDILWQNYISGENPESVRSAFENMPLADWLLDMVASGLLTGLDRSVIQSLVDNTFHGYSGAVIPDEDIGSALRTLTKERFVVLDEIDGTVRTSTLGRAALKGGLSVQQAIHYKRKLGRAYPETLPGWLAVALSGPGWDLPPAILSRREQAQNLPVKALYQHFDGLLDEAGLLLDSGDFRQALTYRQGGTLKSFLLLQMWQNLTPVQTLEERFQMHLGQILSLGETAAYLLAGIAEVLQATDGPSSPSGRLREYAFSLRYGIPFRLRSLHEAFGEILNRRDLYALEQAGIETVPQLFESESGTLDRIIANKDKLLVLKIKMEQLKEELEMHTKSAVVENHHSAVMPSLVGTLESIEIDGAYDRERYLVRINGFPVRLTGKSFKYFTKLAWSRLYRDSGWIYKEDIEIGFNQARYLYRMKGEISSGLNISWPVIENNRLGYYRLSADPSRIRINVENLKNHPDYEVRSLVVN